jgi:hypothetical protein
MKPCKTKICAIAFLLVFAFSFLPTFTVSAADSAATAEEKLPAFLRDVLGIDLTKYTISDQGYGVKYPPELGGVVKQENILIRYNSTSSQISVQATFRNGYIDGIILHATRGSITYRQQPSTSAIAETRNILERYKTFAEKYGIDTAHVTLALSILDKASDAPSSGTTQNLNGISNFNAINQTSGNMRMAASDSEIGFGYVVNGISLRNRGLGLGFANNYFTFADTWGLYAVEASSIISEEEAKAMALDAAKNYKITLMRDDNTSFAVYPDWSNPRVEIGLLMISGQNFNTQLNNDIGAVNQGSKTRNPLGLYPFWSAIVYFTKPIGNIGGVQVGIWGDTKEIAYVTTYGHLGNPDNTGNTGDTSQNPQPFNTGLAIALAFVATAAVLAVAFVAVRKRRK